MNYTRNMIFILVKVLLILQIMKLGKSYDFVCPFTTQWNLRAKEKCPECKTCYACLLNITYKKYDEDCQRPDFAGLGGKYVFQPTNFNFAKCRAERYQPIPFETNGTTDCIFQKSSCSEEGQVVCKNISLEEDVSCRCDYTKGYKFVSNTTNPCYCIPSEEDCSCFKLDNISAVVSTSCEKYSSDKDHDKCIELTTTIPAIKSNRVYGVQINNSRSADIPKNIILLCFSLVMIAIVFGLGMTYVVFVRPLYDENVPSEVLQEHNKVEEEDEHVPSEILQEHNKVEEDENVPSEVLQEHYKVEEQDENVPSEELQEHNKQEEEEDDIPRNIRDQHKNTLKSWTKEDKKYVETNAYRHVLNKIKSNNCVTVVGSPGVGKTALLKHIALYFSRNGYTFFPAIVPEDLRNYYKPGKRRIFVIDDVFGKSSTNNILITAWQQFKTVITDIINDGNYKIIVACRLQIYLDDTFNMLNFFKTCECNIVSPELKLTYEEQIKIAKSLIPNFKIGKTELPDVDCFPLLCHICGANPDIDAAQFFMNPFQVLQEELDTFLKEGIDESRFKLGALALLVLHNNELRKCIFKSDNVHKQIEEICSVLKLPPVSPMNKIQDALGTLKETYVIEDKDSYTMKHEMLFQFILDYFSKSKNINMISCLIDHSSMDMIHERFSLYKVNGEHIIIPKEYHYSYFQRIIQDWFEGHLRNVFDNRNTKQTAYRKEMIQYLKKLDRKKQNDLANINIQTENGECYNPLVWCCYNGYTDILKWLASVGVNINQKVFLVGSWVSPLTISCARNQTEMIRTLIDLDVNVNTIDSVDITPIYVACKRGNLSNVELLLTHKADINIKGQYEVTPLLLACLKNEESTVHLLLLHKANSDYCLRDQCSTHQESKFVHWLETTCIGFVKKYRHVWPQGSLFEFIQGSSPLHIACVHENENIIEDILKENPTTNIQKKDGATPLLIACELGNKDIVRLLLDKKADTEILRKDGASPLSVVTDDEVRKMIACTKEGNATTVHIS